MKIQSQESSEESGRNSEGEEERKGIAGGEGE